MIEDYSVFCTNGNLPIIALGRSWLVDHGLLKLSSKRIGPSTWAIIKQSEHSKRVCLVDRVSLLGLVSGPARLFFKPYQYLSSNLSFK